MSSNRTGKILAVFSALLLGGGVVVYKQIEHAKSRPEAVDDARQPTKTTTQEQLDPMTVPPGSESTAVPAISNLKPAPEDAKLAPLPADPPMGKKAERAIPPSSDPAIIFRPEDAATISPAMIDAIFDNQSAQPVEDVPPP